MPQHSPEKQQHFQTNFLPKITSPKKSSGIRGSTRLKLNDLQTSNPFFKLENDIKQLSFTMDTIRHNLNRMNSSEKIYNRSISKADDMIQRIFTAQQSVKHQYCIYLYANATEIQRIVRGRAGRKYYQQRLIQRAEQQVQEQIAGVRIIRAMVSHRKTTEERKYASLVIEKAYISFCIRRKAYNTLLKASKAARKRFKTAIRTIMLLSKGARAFKAALLIAREEQLPMSLLEPRRPSSGNIGKTIQRQGSIGRRRLLTQRNSSSSIHGASSASLGSKDTEEEHNNHIRLPTKPKRQPSKSLDVANPKRQSSAERALPSITKKSANPSVKRRGRA